MEKDLCELTQYHVRPNGDRPIRVDLMEIDLIELDLYELTQGRVRPSGVKHIRVRPKQVK